LGDRKGGHPAHKKSVPLIYSCSVSEHVEKGGIKPRENWRTQADRNSGR